MKKYRILLLLGGIFSCLFSMELIYSSRVYFRNMYSEHFIYDINIYAQVISIGLIGILFLMLLFKKSKPYFFTIAGTLTMLMNLIAMILYTSIVQDFYFSIYAVRGLVLIFIGIFLQSKRLDVVRMLSLYFFIELLIILVYSTSDDSIFFIQKTFEANLFGIMILLILGLCIPLIMTYLITDENVSIEKIVRKPINIDKVLRISSLISIVYLSLLIIMNFPYLFAILVDANRITIIYYQVSALLRIALFLLLIYAFVNLMKDTIKKWVFPAITIATIITIVFPLTINLQFYFDRFYWLYGVTIDLLLLVILTVLIYIKKYQFAFYLSLWFLFNLLLGSLRIGNLQSIIVFNNVPVRNLEILVQISYYFIPISLILALYKRMKSKRV